MPTNFSGRILLISAILFLALWAILPNGRLLHPNLRPGIDMVGGTSLLYEIKSPEGGYTGSRTLAEDVMESLKKRVDPDGVRNLIWRPQGNSRLEIQMPLSSASEKSAAIRSVYADARRQFDATNVRLSQVQQAVEQLQGDARRDRLNKLAMGSD